MADRVVVMNQGRIEQVGTPQQVYREPETAFVADFVGKVNVISAIADGEGRFRVGTLTLAGARGSGVAAGTRVKLYLRPEDVQVNGSANGHANVASASVQKIEFLGAFCLVTVRLAGAEEQPLVVNVSRQSLDRMAIAEGAALSVGLPPDCMRLLA
jgi:iron(III) transport system ATP-binding protein